MDGAFAVAIADLVHDLVEAFALSPFGVAEEPLPAGVLLRLKHQSKAEDYDQAAAYIRGVAKNEGLSFA